MAAMRPMAIGLLAMVAGCTTPDSSPGPVADLPGAVVQYTLETTPSGEVVSWRATDSSAYGTLTPVRTYRDTLGYCRDFAVTLSAPGGQGSTWQDTACRDSAGVWRLKPVGA
jgi:hypothetical protein